MGSEKPPHRRISLDRGLELSRGHAIENYVACGTGGIQARSVAGESLQAKQIALSEHIAQVLAGGAFLQQFHPALLDRPDEMSFRVTLAEDVLFSLVKLHLSAAGEIEQVRLRENVEGGVLLQKVGHALSNDGCSHGLLMVGNTGVGIVRGRGTVQRRGWSQ